MLWKNCIVLYIYIFINYLINYLLSMYYVFNLISCCHFLIFARKKKTQGFPCVYCTREHKFSGKQTVAFKPPNPCLLEF